MTTPFWGDPNAGPPMNLTPTPEPKKSHKTAWIVGLIILAVLLFCGVGTALAVTNSNTHKGSDPLPTSTAAVTPNATSDFPTEPPAQAAALTKNDVKLTLKTLSRHCFGSDVGCNLELKVVAAVDKAKLGDSSWDVTY